MHITILGSGNVGGALARLWSAAGHQVSLAVRDPNKGAQIPNAAVGLAADLSPAADVVALCVPWSAAEEALRSCGDLAGKLLIDCTNPLTPAFDALAFGGTTSAAERLQGLQPRAHVVKAFNTIGAALLGNAVLGGQQADGFFCGDDAAGKRTAADLIRDAGLYPVDVGPLRNARYLEALAMLWIDLAVHQKRGPSFAFKLIAQTSGDTA